MYIYMIQSYLEVKYGNIVYFIVIWNKKDKTIVWRMVYRFFLLGAPQTT